MLSSHFEVLKQAIVEYGHSLTRVDGEKDHQASIAAQVKEKCEIEPAHFKRLATAYHKDKLDAVYLEAGEMMALVDTLRGESA